VSAVTTIEAPPKVVRSKGPMRPATMPAKSKPVKTPKTRKMPKKGC
jgi:hypothetical protein